jgi:hypothetical protein
MDDKAVITRERGDGDGKGKFSVKHGTSTMGDQLRDFSSLSLIYHEKLSFVV